MSRFFRAVLPALILCAAAGAARADGINLGSHDTGAPISVSADDFSGDLTSKAGTYKGNVIVQQGNFKLHADQVDVRTTKGAIDDIVASGHVLFDAPNGQAKGDKGVYKIGPRTITLSGQVVLTRAKNVMRGTELVVDLNTGKALLTAHGMAGGRVQGLFIPPPKHEAAPATTGEQKPK